MKSLKMTNPICIKFDSPQMGNFNESLGNLRGESQGFVQEIAGLMIRDYQHNWFPLIRP